MAGLLSTLRVRARAISLAAAVLYLLPVLAAMVPAAPASAADEAFAAAVRAGIICTAVAPGAAQPAAPSSVPTPGDRHPAGACVVCLMGCPLGGAAVPPHATAFTPPSLAAQSRAPLAPAAPGPRLGRPASDVAARAPPEPARA